MATQVYQRLRGSHYSQWPARAAAMGVYYAQHSYASDNNGEYTDSYTDLMPYSSDYYPLSDAVDVEIELLEQDEDGKWVTFAASARVPAAQNGGADWVATVHEDRLLTVQAY